MVAFRDDTISPGKLGERSPSNHERSSRTARSVLERGEDAAPLEEIEARESYAQLADSAHKRTGSIPEEILVRHVLAVTRGGDWPVRREAMNAVLRRIGFARRDELLVASRPGNREVLGLYRTRRKGVTRPRPYSTVLERIDPLQGSCDCPDYLRSSLGLCKHLLVVLEDLAGKPQRFAAACRGDAVNESLPRLHWDPVRPLRGTGDALTRIRWKWGAHVTNARLRRVARRWFRRDPREGDDLILKESAVSTPARRLELVVELLPEVKARRASLGTPDPALVAVLEHEKERLRRAVSERPDGRSVRAALRRLRKSLYKYQIAGVERFLSRGRLLLADDMGLGKTAQAIAGCHVLWEMGKIRRGLIVVPASLKPQWKREWQLFSDAPIEIVEGTPAERAVLYRKTSRGFLIVNYEQILRDLETMHRWNPDLVVLDEAQRIKNWATKTAACVKTLKPRYRLVLTGTPMENRLDELASIFDWVDDFALEPKWRLVPWHSEYADGWNEIVGARNLDTLRVRLHDSMLRRVRQEVLEQLPPRTDIRVPVELTAEQLEEHEALAKPIAQLRKRAQARPLTQAEFLRLMQLLTAQRIISNGMAQLRFEGVWPEIESRSPTDALLRTLASPKLVEFRELIARLVIDQGRKIVVFSQWRRMLRLARWAVEDVLGDAGLRAVFFTGHEGQKRRAHNVVDFHDDPDTRVFFASDAGGVGLNLQQAANCCINLELPWNPAVLEQRIGRIYRLGQKLPIDTYNLISERCIEERIAGIVGSKRAFFEGLFDGESDSVTFERSGSFLSRIEEVVSEPDVPSVEDEGEDDEDDDLAEPGVGAEEKEIDILIAQADEETDLEPIASSEPERPHAAPGRRASRGELDAEPRPARSAPALQLDELFGQLRMERRVDGSVRIDAPPAAAEVLGAVFEGMARMLREAAASDERSD